jgi:hypothetical protein
MRRRWTYKPASGGDWMAIDCPNCGMAVRVDVRGDRLDFDCQGQCGADIAAAVDQDAIREELGAERSNAQSNGQPPNPVERLSALYGLSKLGLRVTGARIFGRGGTASVYLGLSDGREIIFERLRDMAKPQFMLTELAACAGASPKLKQPQCIEALVLIRELAEHHETATLDELSREWGMTFLYGAGVLDLDMEDQGERWGAFEQLDRIDPVALAFEHRTAVAQKCLVLRDLQGSRYVRTGWFRVHVKRDDAAVSPAQIAQRMERVGWRRRGREGLIKATRPGFHGVLHWRFYVVPAGWEEGE